MTEEETLPILPTLRPIDNDDEIEKRITIGVLALQGAFLEHLNQLVRISNSSLIPNSIKIEPILVKTSNDLIQCSGLIIPGGESTTMNLLAANQIDHSEIEPNLRKFSMMDWLKSFVKSGRAVFGTCAGLILLSDEVCSLNNKPKKGSLKSLKNEKDLSSSKPKLCQDPISIGGLPIKTIRNQYGNQLNSFERLIEVPCLLNPENPFPAVFIRAPMIHTINQPANPGIDCNEQVKKLVKLPLNESMTKDYSHDNEKKNNDVNGNGNGEEYIKALEKDENNDSLGPDHEIVGLSFKNILGISFHPELTCDYRFHLYWILNFVLTK